MAVVRRAAGTRRKPRHRPVDLHSCITPTPLSPCGLQKYDNCIVHWQDLAGIELSKKQRGAAAGARVKVNGR
jgi:hypothetical protein